MNARVTERCALVLAANANVMTLDGTNTWVLREPGGTRSVVVDPGPADRPHLDAVLAVAGEVGLVLFSHRHIDHTGAIDQIVDRTGAPARAFDPKYCRQAETLEDGELIEVDGLRIEVVSTPGHTTDSACFHLPDESSLLTGDHILGRGTTVIVHPDGAVRPYLDSLARVEAMIETGRVRRLLPGHGPVVTAPKEHVGHYIRHRRERLRQVRAALDQGAQTPRDVVELVYADVDTILWGPAELTVAAQLAYLRSVDTAPEER